MKNNAWSTAPHSDACRDRIEIELSKTVDGRRRLGLVKTRHDRLAHELGNADGRQDLPPQGEIVPGVVVEDPAASSVPSFLELPSRIGQPVISDEAMIGQPGVSDEAHGHEARSGGHEARGGGHEVNSGGHEARGYEVHSGGHVDPFDYEACGNEVESDGGVPPNPASDMDIGVVEDDLRELFAVLQRDDRAAI